MGKKAAKKVETEEPAQNTKKKAAKATKPQETVQENEDSENPQAPDQQEEDDQEIKEPPKKRQKTEANDKKTDKAPDKKQKSGKAKVEEKPAEEVVEEEEQEDEEEQNNQDEETQATNQNQNQVVVGSSIGQLKKIEDKKPFTDSEAEQVIAEWMEKQNRPYSVQNLLDNFQHQLKRPQCIRIMDQLVESQILTCKEYGKAKVYLINQDCFPEVNPEQLTLLDEQIQVRKDEFSELEDNLKQSKEKLKEASVGQANSTLKSDLQQLQQDIAQLQKMIQPFKESGAKMLTEKDLLKAEGDLKKWQIEWKRRKRACLDIINAISESMEMNRKDFIKKVGLETDEENKVVCPL